ncbi:galactose mutarotase-like [Oryza brachyantha]|nr:galactose mutarotase-like [Oryza brachyantha]
MARAVLPLTVLALCLAALVFSSRAGADAAAGRKMVGVYELKKGDFSIRVTNWGATLMSVVLPDSNGNLGDVVLGYDTVAEYVNGTAYFGGLIGRVANRVANARFTLDGKTYRLFRNDGNNSLHGGHRGFSKVVWTVREHVGGGASPCITLFYHSFDGEQGFPGDLDVYVTYELRSPYVLAVRMNATARGKATPVNLAHHAYWNLGGHGSGTVLDETVQLFASRYTPVDAALIPTGRLAPVAGTPYDFRRGAAARVGSRVGVPGGVSGYDTNYAVDGAGAGGHQRRLRPVAVVRDGATGRAMELWADQPGVQFYTGNGLAGVRGKDGRVYGRYGALCLETQGFPDAVNHPSFPSQIVRPGQVYEHNMVFRFSFF